MRKWGAARNDLRGRASLVSSGNLLGIGQLWLPVRWRPTPHSLVVVHCFGPQWDCRYFVWLICRHSFPSDFGGWLHRCSISQDKSSLHLFWGARWKISDGRHIWVGEGGHGFSHDGWMEAVTGFFSNVFLQLLHCSGEFFRCYLPKVKTVAFQVSAPDLVVSISFRIRAWFISRFFAYVILGIGGFTLVPVIRDLWFINLRWAGWFWFGHPPTFPWYLLFLRWIHIFVFQNLYGLIKSEICIKSLLSSLLDR